MNLLYFSTLAWDEAGGAHNPTQIARALARQGHCVLFVEPQPSAVRETGNNNLSVVALTELGMTPTALRRAWYGLDSGDIGNVAAALAVRMDAWDTQESCAAIYAAPFDPFVRLAPMLRARGCAIVYYAMDDFAAAPALGYTQFAAGAEDYLVRECDVLCGVTEPLARSLGRFGKQAHVIPNGVEREMWRRNGAGNRPPMLQRGEVTLGFWGTLIDSMFDADLVAHVAAARPRWVIHLVGAPDPEPHRASVLTRLQEMPNVIFHGAVAHDQLPGYARAFDVALAPFPDNAFTRARDPIKVYEYLAAHLPIVSSYTPQLETIPNVQVAHSADEFLAHIERAARTPIQSESLEAFLSQQTWGVRAERLIELIPRTTARTSITTNEKVPGSFARPDTAAVMRYAAALEQELSQVQAWARTLEKQAQADTALDRVKRWMPSLRGRAND